MQARDVMTQPVITFRPGTPIREAATILTGRQITAAPVLDDNAELVGMVSEGDLINHRFAHDPRSHARRDQPADDEDTPQTVGEVMSTTVVAMSPTADAADLADTMLQYDVRSVPIVEGGTVIGIVSRRDLLRTLIRDEDTIRAEVRTRLCAYTDGQQQWDVEIAGDRVDIFGDIGDDAEAKVLHVLASTVAGVNHVTLHHRHPAATDG